MRVIERFSQVMPVFFQIAEHREVIVFLLAVSMVQLVNKMPDMCLLVGWQWQAAHPSVQAHLMDVLKVQGTAVVVGSYKKPPEVDLLKVEFKELTLIGIRVYERRDFEIAASILGSGTIDFELMLSVSAPEQAPQVFQDLLKGTDAIKMLFKL